MRRLARPGRSIRTRRGARKPRSPRPSGRPTTRTIEAGNLMPSELNRGDNRRGPRRPAGPATAMTIRKAAIWRRRQLGYFGGLFAKGLGFGLPGAPKDEVGNLYKEPPRDGLDCARRPATRRRRRRALRRHQARPSNRARRQSLISPWVSLGIDRQRLDRGLAVSCGALPFPAGYDGPIQPRGPLVPHDLEARFRFCAPPLWRSHGCRRPRPAAGPDVAHFTLANGLEVVVIPDHRTPVVTHMVWYRVGAADETPGKIGPRPFPRTSDVQGHREEPARAVLADRRHHRRPGERLHVERLHRLFPAHRRASS